MSRTITATQALNQSRKFRDPKTTTGVFKQIDAMSRLGFRSLGVMVPTRPTRAVQDLLAALERRGFETFTEHFDAKHFLVTVQWDSPADK